VTLESVSQAQFEPRTVSVAMEENERALVIDGDHNRVLR
jgi:hypothetical protein